MPASRAATLIGATQMFGMAGGSAGQFVVGPLIAGLQWTLLAADGHHRPSRSRLLLFCPHPESGAAAELGRPSGPGWAGGARRWARCSATRSRSCAA
jgi:hypothetical protein